MVEKLFQIIKQVFLAGCFLLSACHKQELQIQPSFYFWRTSAHLSASEKQTLKGYGVKNLYIRFFDVDVSDDTHEPKPIGILDSLSSLPQDLEMITPVVYITNRTFLQLKENEVITFAKNVSAKVNSIYSGYRQLQIDCDWSEKSKKNYFHFLRELRTYLPKGTMLSATIRLHQVKYPLRNGIPPVDRGMLMFYNMGNLHDMSDANSIYNEETALKYTSYLKRYSLHLDAALPIFRWYVHYRNGQVINLITKQHLPDIKDSLYFSASGNDCNFKVKQAQLMKGIYYKEGDVLKYEAIDDATLLKAASLLNESLIHEDRTIILYDLDDYNINNYEPETIKTIFTAFN